MSKKTSTSAANGRAATARTTRVSTKDVSRVMKSAIKREGSYFRVTDSQRRAAG